MSAQTSKQAPSDATTSNEDLTKDEDNYDKGRFHNRKGQQRRRPPTPPTSMSHADVVAASNDLRQRILEILGKDGI